MSDVKASSTARKVLKPDIGISLGLGLTNECNLKCAFCYRDPTRADRLSLDQVKSVNARSGLPTTVPQCFHCDEETGFLVARQTGYDDTRFLGSPDDDESSTRPLCSFQLSQRSQAAQYASLYLVH